MPTGYTTYYAGSFEDLAAQQEVMAAREESAPEGTLALLELTLAQPALPETLAELNSRLLAAGVPPWGGYSSVVFSDTANPDKLYIAWVKGFAWSGMIVGILLFLLPTILGGMLWFLIPQGIRDMMVMAGFMAVMPPFMKMAAEEAG
jgi:hypothetical protein